jgi:hypothetical protein
MQLEDRIGEAIQMGLAQMAIGVCNDGNVSQLDVADEPEGDVYYRIEVYRCSHPAGGYGVTLSGSRVEHIAGSDHLTPQSNRVFRYLFSLGTPLHIQERSASPLGGSRSIQPARNARRILGDSAARY